MTNIYDCPCCGALSSDDLRINKIFIHGGRDRYIKCDVCNLKSPRCSGNDDGAITIWNTMCGSIMETQYKKFKADKSINAGLKSIYDSISADIRSYFKEEFEHAHCEDLKNFHTESLDQLVSSLLCRCRNYKMQIETLRSFKKKVEDDEREYYSSLKEDVSKRISIEAAANILKDKTLSEILDLLE